MDADVSCGGATSDVSAQSSLLEKTLTAKMSGLSQAKGPSVAASGAVGAGANGSGGEKAEMGTQPSLLAKTLSAKLSGAGPTGVPSSMEGKGAGMEASGVPEAERLPPSFAINTHGAAGKEQVALPSVAMSAPTVGAGGVTGGDAGKVPGVTEAVRRQASEQRGPPSVAIRTQGTMAKQQKTPPSIAVSAPSSAGEVTGGGTASRSTRGPAETEQRVPEGPSGAAVRSGSGTGPTRAVPRIAAKTKAGGAGSERKGADRIDVSFSLPYETLFGQNLVLVGSVEALGMWRPEDGLRMAYVHPGMWTATVNLSSQVV